MKKSSALLFSVFMCSSVAANQQQQLQQQQQQQQQRQEDARYEYTQDKIYNNPGLLLLGLVPSRDYDMKEHVDYAMEISALSGKTYESISIDLMQIKRCHHRSDMESTLKSLNLIYKNTEKPKSAIDKICKISNSYLNSKYERINFNDLTTFYYKNQNSDLSSKFENELNLCRTETEAFSQFERVLEEIDQKERTMLEDRVTDIISSGITINTDVSSFIRNRFMKSNDASIYRIDNNSSAYYKDQETPTIYGSYRGNEFVAYPYFDKTALNNIFDFDKINGFYSSISISSSSSSKEIRNNSNTLVRNSSMGARILKRFDIVIRRIDINKNNLHIEYIDKTTGKETSKHYFERSREFLASDMCKKFY